MNSKRLVNSFVWNHQYFVGKKKILGGPWEFHQRLIYIAPSSDRSLLILNLSFNVIWRRFEVFSDVWSEMLHVQKINSNSFIFTNWYDIMALTLY